MLEFFSGCVQLACRLVSIWSPFHLGYNRTLYQFLLRLNTMMCCPRILERKKEKTHTTEMRWDSILAYCLSFINQQWNHTTTPCRAGRSSVATRRGSCQYKDVLGSRACDAMRGLLYEACKPGGPALWPCGMCHVWWLAGRRTIIGPSQPDSASVSDRRRSSRRRYDSKTCPWTRVLASLLDIRCRRRGR